MKNLFLSLVLVLVSLTSKSQVIDVNNFNEKLFEKVLFHKMIEFRLSVGADSVVWSDVLYNNISKPNTTKMMNANYLFHPDEGDIWKTRPLRDNMGKELVKKQKVTLLVSETNGPRFLTFEIAASIPNFNVETYQDLADKAIIGWSTSPHHKNIQKAPMIQDGAFAMASCSVKKSKNGKEYFIEFDFSIPFCIE
jgi:hypothetical protein